MVGLSGGVVDVMIGTRVFNVGLFIWDGVEAGCVDHFVGDAAAELLDLFSNVQLEGIGAPASQKHDGVHRDPIKIHGHCTSGAVGVGPDGRRRET